LKGHAFLLLALEKYFLKNNLTKSFQEETKLAAKPYIHHLAESFKEKGINFIRTTSTEILGKCIMKHTSSSSLNNKYAF